MRFDAATISTIHGFCQRVLTEHSFAHRRLFEQRLVDGREMVARGFRTVLGRQLGARGALREQLLAWLRQGNDLGRLEKLVAEAVRQRGVLTPRWDPAALAAAARVFLDACDDELLGRALDAAGSSTQRRGERDPRPLIATLAAANEADSLGEQLREWGRKKVTVDGKEDRLWSLLRRGLARLAQTDVAAARAVAALDTLRDGMAPPLAALVGGLRDAVAELAAGAEARHRPLRLRRHAAARARGALRPVAPTPRWWRRCAGAGKWRSSTSSRTPTRCSGTSSARCS